MVGFLIGLKSNMISFILNSQMLQSHLGFSHKLKKNKIFVYNGLLFKLSTPSVYN